MNDLDQLTNEIEQCFMQFDGWNRCRYALGGFFKKLQSENELLKEELLKANTLVQVCKDNMKEYYEIKIKLIKEQQ